MIKSGMESFFFEHKQARKVVYMNMLILWLLLLLIKTSSPTPKQVMFAAIGYPIVAIVLYFFSKLSLPLIYLLTKRIEIYRILYWFGIFGVVVCIITMTYSNAELFGEASIATLYFISLAWASRAAYFDFRDYKKKKN